MLLSCSSSTQTGPDGGLKYEKDDDIEDENEDEDENDADDDDDRKHYFNDLSSSLPDLNCRFHVSRF